MMRGAVAGAVWEGFAAHEGRPVIVSICSDGEKLTWHVDGEYYATTDV